MNNLEVSDLLLRNSVSRCGRRPATRREECFLVRLSLSYGFVILSTSDIVI